MEKIWLKQYPQGIPSEINPDAYSSLVDLFEKTCQKFPNKIAVSNYGVSLTYAELRKKARDFAAYLQQKLQLKKGDRVAIMLPNVLQYIVCMMGILEAGLVVVNVNPLYTPPEVVHQLNDAQVSAMIVLENFAHTVQLALPELSLQFVIVTRMGDLFPFPKSYLANFVVKYVKKLIPKWAIPDVIYFSDALHESKHLSFKPVPLSGQDIAYLQYTGGTTGHPKGAMLTHRNMVANTEQATAWISNVTKLGEEIIITALPLYHIFSLLANWWVFMKLGAHSVLITNPRDIHGFIKELKGISFTAITGVNTLFNALLRQPGFATLNFSHLKITLGGGMAVQPSVAEKWKEVTGVPLIEAYGLTETSPAVAINPLDLHDYNGSVGLPVPSTDISIRDEEGHELGLNQPGELWVKGPQVMQGYWHEPEETAHVLKDGWLYTGDVAMMNEQGYLRIVDRKKDMILISGFNVYPNEVEEIIAACPGVQEVGVVGVPDERTGEAVKAFVVKSDPALTEAQVFEFCKNQLTLYKIPKTIEFVTELPKTTVGKILRRELRKTEPSL
ncbi:MAG: AMP-binding protein [Proteobacteria bacterium]|nr:AMP-binding protein [Pseudomonadota bacterium]